MNDRFKKQDLVAIDDKEKFDLACNLLTEQIIKENPGIEVLQAMKMAFAAVSDVMTETIIYRAKMRKTWEFLTAIHYN